VHESLTNWCARLDSNLRPSAYKFAPAETPLQEFNASGMQDEENFARSTPLQARPAHYILTARDPQVYLAERHRETIDPRALTPI